MSVHNPTNQGRSDDELRLTARLMMLMVDSGKSWGEPGHEGVDGDKQVIGVMDAAAIAAAAVAEPSFLPWLLTQAGYELTVRQRCEPAEFYALMPDVEARPARVLERREWISAFLPVGNKENIK